MSTALPARRRSSITSQVLLPLFLSWYVVHFFDFTSVDIVCNAQTTMVVNGNVMDTVNSLLNNGYKIASESSVTSTIVPNIVTAIGASTIVANPIFSTTTMTVLPGVTTVMPGTETVIVSNMAAPVSTILAGNPIVFGSSVVSNPNPGNPQIITTITGNGQMPPFPSSGTSCPFDPTGQMCSNNPSTSLSYAARASLPIFSYTPGTNINITMNNPMRFSMPGAANMPMVMPNPGNPYSPLRLKYSSSGMMNSINVNSPSVTTQSGNIRIRFNSNPPNPSNPSVPIRINLSPNVTDDLKSIPLESGSLGNIKLRVNTPNVVTSKAKIDAITMGKSTIPFSNTDTISTSSAKASDYISPSSRSTSSSDNSATSLNSDTTLKSASLKDVSTNDVAPGSSGYTAPASNSSQDGSISLSSVSNSTTLNTNSTRVNQTSSSGNNSSSSSTSEKGTNYFNSYGTYSSSAASLYHLPAMALFLGMTSLINFL